MKFLQRTLKNKTNLDKRMHKMYPLFLASYNEKMHVHNKKTAQMNGNYNGNECYFNKIVPNADIRDIILKSHHSGNIDYMKPHNYFHIGDVDNIDHEDCGLYVENSTCKVVGIDWDSAMDCDFSKPLSEFMFKICDSLEELIDTMEVKRF